ncbi:PAS domain-containing protein [Qipengyuania atrilutea]|uniref:histidine kinase n=1 Tax=Qipengyuania atrilutea TaxID=2744473 RepID=A0A850H0W0_9SPHN|nr:PAS domain-containing protein [Actirhodobacter atriluteus]NVD45564.1 PAS domain-containing protein [Actirhodobacter atriluteus]
MSELDAGDVPEKQPPDDQEEREIDARRVDDSANLSPDKAKLDSARLFTQAMEQTRMALCISDPNQDDCPIVYVNEAFVLLTGYDRDEIVGRNCRFLQGEDTSEEAVEKIQAAIDEREVRVIDILNYRKDGSAFWNALHIGPIFDDDGKLVYFYGSQWDVTEILSERERQALNDNLIRELQHRLDNLFSVIIAIIRLSGRNETDPQAMSDKIIKRIQALSAAHRASIAPDVGTEGADLCALVEEVLQPYRTSRSDRIGIVGPETTLPRNAVTPVGLALHELATNAVKYGSLSTPRGEVKVDWENAPDCLQLHWIEQGGPPIDQGIRVETKGSGIGARLIDNVLRGIDASIETDFRESGFAATITLPIAGGSGEQTPA